MIHRSDVDLEECIGEGSFGRVYSGIYRGGKVAVKKALRAVDEFLQEVLRKEAGIMLNISPHPNLVQFFGGCFDADGVLLVVELCDAGSLDRYLAKQPNLDLVTRLDASRWQPACTIWSTSAWCTATWPRAMSCSHTPMAST